MTRMIEGEAAVAVSELEAARDRQTALNTDVLPRVRMAIEPTVASYASGQLPMVSVIESIQALWLFSRISSRQTHNSGLRGRGSAAPLDRTRRSSNDTLCSPSTNRRSTGRGHGAPDANQPAPSTPAASAHAGLIQSSIEPTAPSSQHAGHDVATASADPQASHRE